MNSLNGSARCVSAKEQTSISKELTVICEIKQLSGAPSPRGAADVTTLENKGDTSRALKLSQKSA